MWLAYMIGTFDVFKARKSHTSVTMEIMSQLLLIPECNTN